MEGMSVTVGAAGRMRGAPIITIETRFHARRLCLQQRVGSRHVLNRMGIKTNRSTHTVTVTHGFMELQILYKHRSVRWCNITKSRVERPCNLAFKFYAGVVSTGCEATMWRPVDNDSQPPNLFKS